MSEISTKKCAADAYLREMTAMFHDSIVGPTVRPGSILRQDVEAYRKTLDFWLEEDDTAKREKEQLRRTVGALGNCPTLTTQGPARSATTHLHVRTSPPPSAQEVPMDIEKMVEDGARALVMCYRSENKNRSEETIREATKLFMTPARAVLAIALAAAADEDAALTKGDLLLAAGEMTAGELRTVRAVLNWRAAHRRNLAAQLGGKTDG